MRSLARVPADVRALLTDRASAEELLPFAEDEGYASLPVPNWTCWRATAWRAGSTRSSRVVRATGDNPLTSPAWQQRYLEEHAERGADLSHYLGCPLGTGVEVVEAEALFAAERDAAAPEEREHITTFLYRHPERFSIFEPLAPASAHARGCPCLR